MNGIKEEWRDVRGYEGIYKISSYGKVISIDRISVNSLGKVSNIKGAVKKLSKDRDGYEVFKACKKGGGKLLKVHGELLKAFCPIEGMNELVVNHLDGVKDNNCLNNLEWTSVKGNSQHYRKTLASGKYERSSMISDDDIVSLLDDFISKRPRSEILSKYKISKIIYNGLVNVRNSKPLISENFDLNKISLEVRRRRHERTKARKKSILSFFESKKDIILVAYRISIDREDFSEMFTIPEKWARFLFTIIERDYPEMAMVRKKKKGAKIALTKQTKKYCMEHGLTYDNFMESLK